MQEKLNRQEMAKIAIPKPKGELSDFLRFLSEVDCETEPVGNSGLVFKFPYLSIPILLVAMRPRDIGKAVADPDTNFCFGFTGSDIVAEQGLTPVGDLPVEAQRQPPNLVLGSTPNFREKVAQPRLESLSDMPGARITTAYPNLTKKWLAERQIDAEVMELQGATEAFWWGDPFSMAVLDVVQTGKTFADEDITPMETMMGPTTIQVIRTPDSTEFKAPKPERFLMDFLALDDLMTRIFRNWRIKQNKRR